MRYGQVPPVGVRPRRVCAHSPASTCTMRCAGESPRAQTLYTELKPLLEFIVAGGLATTVKAGLGLLGVGAGDPRRPLLPLDDDGRAALQKLPTDV
jgi:dihydrodipicolinate synthase/N-acetylneuraminate lyase